MYASFDAHQRLLFCFQIGLVEILRALEFEPDRVIGHSLGELACAYADNCLTLEQTILASHARGKASIEAKLVKGMMAAIGTQSNIILHGLLKAKYIMLPIFSHAAKF